MSICTIYNVYYNYNSLYVYTICWGKTGESGGPELKGYDYDTLYPTSSSVIPSHLMAWAKGIEHKRNSHTLLTPFPRIHTREASQTAQLDNAAQCCTMLHNAAQFCTSVRSPNNQVTV